MKTQNALPEVREGAGSFGKYFGQPNYFVGTTSYCCTGGISWKAGKRRRPGAFGSLVQQQETVVKATAAAARERKIRVMECGGRFFSGKLGKLRRTYFDGAT
jgi:hypothetical protein